MLSNGLNKNGSLGYIPNLFILTMDDPKTRRETKKNQSEKGKGKDGKYSQKHIRAVESLKQSKHSTSK